MHDFNYKKNKLYCEGVALDAIVRKVGSPCYVYSRKSLTEHFLKIKRAFRAVDPLICYAVKANSSLKVLKLMKQSGAGMDIVSAGELYRALKVGVNPGKIVFAGVGKTAAEIAYAIKAGILLFNVESPAELVMIDGIARALKKRIKVALRINPDIPIDTHKYIATGKGDSKFGIDFGSALEIFKAQDTFKGLDICGIHIHVGSQLVSNKPFINGVQKTLAFIGKNKIRLKFFNIGGGLGIVYDKEKPQTAAAFAKKIVPLLKKAKCKIIMEPGRFIAGNSGALVTKVIYKKKTSRKNFAIVDAAMNDLLRPSIYSAFHTVLPVVKNGNSKELIDVVGPVCESGDFLAKDRRMQILGQGDLIAVLGAGAYGFVMSSNYNSRPRACEVLVSGKRIEVIRRRETLKDLIRGETY